jgi:hypothetical protein
MEKTNLTPLKDSSSLSFVQGLISLAFSFVFLNETFSANSNFVYLHRLADDFSWFLIFFIYGTTALFVSRYKFPALYRLILWCFGLWIWWSATYSFMFDNYKNLTDLEFLFFIPILNITWMMVSIIIRQFSASKSRINIFSCSLLVNLFNIIKRKK